MQRLKNLNWKKLSWVIAIEIAIILAVSTFFLPGGADLYIFYYPFAQGCLDCAFVPYYTYWLLWPLGMLPAVLAWPLVTIAAVLVMLLVLRHTKVNPMLVYLSFPFLAQMWLGQIDFIEIGGLAIALLAANPYLRGLGIVLALTKPQVAGLAVLFLLTKEKWKDIPKALAVPMAVLVISMVVYGPLWPLEWFSNAEGKIPLDVYRYASDMIWPLGLALVWTPLLFKDRRTRFEAALLVTSIASPLYGVYYYTAFLAFRSYWWTTLLSYAWALLYPWMGASAMKFAWVLPVGMLVHMGVEEWGRRRKVGEGAV